MLHNLLKLFGKAPSEPLKEHVTLVFEAVFRVPKLIDALDNEDKETLLLLKEEIYRYEEQAEKIKSVVRSNLLSSLSLSIDKSVLLELVMLQDALANKAKDSAFLCTVRPFALSPSLRDPLHQVVEKNIEACTLVRALLLEMPALIEASFSGLEAEKAIVLIEQIAQKEREADAVQLKLLQALLDIDTTLSPGQFHIYNSLFECIASLSNISEKIALAIRATIEL